MAIPNHKSTVSAARALYNHLSGEQRAYCVVNETAWRLKDEGAGTFFKDSGSQYQLRSVDIVMYKPGNETFDVLGDAEGQCVPQWGPTAPTGHGDPARWRAPIDPATIRNVCPLSGPPPIEPPPTTEPPTAGDLEPRVAALESAVRQQTEAIRLLTAAQTAVAGRVQALEQAPANVAAAVDAVVAEVVVDFHETGRASWPAHRHGVDAGVALKRKS